MSEKEKTLKRSAMLKELRKTHQETIQRAHRLLKAYNESKEIYKAIKDEPRTVPEAAKIVGMPTHQVLWYLTAMKKYEDVVEEGMSGGYVLYKKAEE
jgi:predicted Rossmann fold nucleotide-binding protein DprA/Smf involved in DNA uptake